MADKKISELVNITGSNIADTDEFVVVDSSASETKAITASELRTAIGNGDFTVTGDLTVQGTTITIDSASAQTVDLGDNDKIRLGDGDDLQLYHDGFNSVISDGGTGGLLIYGSDVIFQKSGSSERMLDMAQDGAVRLYHNSAIKLATTSTGIDVTGTVTADGLTVDGHAAINGVITSESSTYPQTRIYRSGSSTLTNRNWTSFLNNDGAFIVKDETGGYDRVAWTVDGQSLFYGNGTERMRIDSNGNVGIGTSSPSSLLDVDKSQNSETNIEITNTNTGSAAQVRTKYTTDGGLFTVGKTSNAHSYGGDAYIHNVDNTNIRFATNDTERMRIDSSGNVGIGDSSPNAPLVVNVATNANLAVQNTSGALQLQGINDAKNAFTSIDIAGNPITFSPNSTEAMRILSDGGFGFNYASDPSTLNNSPVLAIRPRGGANSAANYFDFGSTNRNANGLNKLLAFKHGYWGGSQEVASIGVVTTSSTGGSGHGYGNLVFHTGESGNGDAGSTSTERMRIDSSGNLLVGKTSASATVVGVMAKQDGFLGATSDGDFPLLVNRLTSDGDIAVFRKDGSTVGSIGVQSTDQLYIGTPDGNGVGIVFDGDNRKIDPTNGSGSNLDAAVDLGNGSHRFKDLYLSGGVYLGGTGAANKLDDYEEGTWTANLAGNTTAAISSGSSCEYTKIGNMVYASFALQLNNNSDTANFRISGLPFNIGSSENDRGGMAHGWQNSGNDYISNGPQNANEFHIYDNSGSYYSFSNWSGKFIKGTFIYRVN